MHSHRMAHLDISIRNLLTDYKCHYAYIDFECCRRFDAIPNALVRGCRGTDLPPELERGEWSDPYKADVWSLAILILRSSKVGLFLLLSSVFLTDIYRCPDTMYPSSSLSPVQCSTRTIQNDQAQLLP